MTWLVSQRPVTGSLIGPCHEGIGPCSYGSRPFGTRSNAQVTLNVFSSSIGTRHSKWLPVNNALGHKHTRPMVQSGSDSFIPSRMRRYTNPYSNSSKSSFKCLDEYGPSSP